MNQIKSAQVYRLALGFLSFIFALHAQAACTFFDAFQDNKDGTVTDPRNGVIWKRCAEGFDWNGSACVGSAKRGSWVDAMKIAKQSRFQNQRDWRLPTKIEMEQVVGKAADCSTSNYKKGEYAASSMIVHPMREDNSSGAFWSSSPIVGYAHNAWVVNFHEGNVYYLNRYYALPVRLVRAGQSLGGNAALEFQREYAQRIASQQEKSLINALGFSYLSEVENLAEKMRQSNYPAASWKATNQLPNDSGNLYSGDWLALNEYVLVALAGLVKSDQKTQTVSRPSEPSAPRDLASRKTQLSKGEFESAAQFATRQARADATAQAEFDRDQRAYDANKRDYDAAVEHQADTQARSVADSNDPEKYKALAAKHLPQAVSLVLGNPVLSDITYDADKQVFNANLKSSRGSFSQPVTVAASPAEAPKLKQDLLSQKIAPVVTLQLPSLVATMVLEENTALRTESFAQANNSPRKLLELIAEYPSSAEARAAKQRIPAAQREAYDAAVRSNSASAYQAFISDFAGTDTQKLLPQAEKFYKMATLLEDKERVATAQREKTKAEALANKVAALSDTSVRFSRGDNEAYDVGAKLIWKRCPDGNSIESNGICSIYDYRYTRTESRLLEKNDWRLPTASELSRIFIIDSKNSSIFSKIFPTSGFWYRTNDNKIVMQNNDGKIDNGYDSNSYRVILVKNR